ncbi:hypothetical protein JOF48_003165 [Arthrobacter stackebrandtii]|uniref:Carboxylesterase n=1 Tax=Arthrobacter stackebrandtii TaxID=272161 RepID=A0ABS4Z042_9MICC|nr:DUF1214 domain-containing protein [Arthrobacter stackebrandtii]MBP2414366.1 hypothetical protein [Arthrobacter stackebrandtii]PYH01506.1 carboxylesterase [Arthrobacter stackebrandtii]
MTEIHVNAANFARAESDRMFAAIVHQAGGTGQWSHGKVPTPVDDQPIIRMNRDTLYSAAVVDISAGADLTIPDVGNRYVSVMVVNQDHYINRVFHTPGSYRLDVEEFGTGHVMVAARILVDPENPEDVAQVNALQDQLVLQSASNRPFVLEPYDEEAVTATRAALLELAKGLSGLDGCFGKKQDVDPIRHLIGTAAGWGGLPDAEASYINVTPGLPAGRYTLDIADVPVDGFWSISLYNAEGYFEENPAGAYNVNNITGTPNADGSVTVIFGGEPGEPNALPIMDGWNYLVRLYRPRAEVLDGGWQFPSINSKVTVNHG